MKAPLEVCFVPDRVTLTNIHLTWLIAMDPHQWCLKTSIHASMIPPRAVFDAKNDTRMSLKHRTPYNLEVVECYSPGHLYGVKIHWYAMVYGATSVFRAAALVATNGDRLWHHVRRVWLMRPSQSEHPSWSNIPSFLPPQITDRKLLYVSSLCTACKLR